MNQPPDECAKSPSVAGPLPTPPTEPSETSEVWEKQRALDDKEYGSYRESLLKVEQDTAKEYDKWVLTLAGVVLGFSLTLVKEVITPNAPMNAPGLLYAAWGLLALPLALGLLNLQLSYSAFKVFRRIVDEEYAAYTHSSTFWKNVRDRMACVKRNKCIEVFNWISLISFLLGIFFLAMFVYNNGTRRPNEQTPETTNTAQQALAGGDRSVATGRGNTGNRDTATATNPNHGDFAATTAPATQKH